MIIRQLRTCITLISIYLTFVEPQTGVPSLPDSNKTSHSCDAEMFSCVNDESCIPMDWVGDNELDCSDGSDEHSNSQAFNLPISSKSNKIKQKNKDAFVSKPLLTDPAVKEQHNKFPSLNDKSLVCSSEHERQMNECARSLEVWIADLAQTNFSTFSLLSDDSSIKKVEHGCNLYHEFTSCIDSLPNNCQLQHPDVRDFHALQMFTCELLAPSVKEHWSCFSALGRESCPIVRRSTKASTFCALMDSINAEIECIMIKSPSACDEVAVEMFDPMKTEAQHSLEDIECLGPTSDRQLDLMNSSLSIDQQPIEHEVENQTPPNAGKKVLPALTTAMSHQNEPSAEVNFSNALYVFGNVKQICAVDNKTDFWAAIRNRVCSRQADLALHSECFLNSEQREQLAGATPCATIDAFNKNIDCIINAMNEFCPIEAQDLVIAIQEGLNDDAISLKCYEEMDKTKFNENNESTGDADFKLKPVNPRCSAEQENQALVCLVELIEINNKLAKFRTTNFLAEISDSNSQLLNSVCELYNKYESCLNNSVFNATNGRRCSFSSPLNTLARIGLSPICSAESRQILFANKNCLHSLLKIPAATQCQSGLQFLDRTVDMIINGIHSEALLCNIFYMLRSTFECGESLVQSHCDARAVSDLLLLKNKITELGVVEGCPKEKPADLDAIIAKPVNRGQLRNQVPLARPIINNVPIAPACEPEEQKRFGECIQPLTAFQPHPLAVIKQPKAIDNACKAYKTFNECRTSIRCNPLWARGMSAMFEFACGSGYERFNKVRQCIRKTTTREDIRECVNVFSKGAPQKACESSNRLLTCSLPPIKEKCGSPAVDFVKEYVQHFASTIDTQCRIGESVGTEAITTYNCTAAEDQIIHHCSAPLNDLGARLEELFQGGMQSFLKNLNNLTPVFAQGCNLTNEFHDCARSILDSNTSCIVSSCLIKSGNSICNQPDIAAAIDNQLGCIFKQVSDPDFGKCLRSTVATLKEFSLVAIREMLPKFTTCVEPIVIKKCGPAPLNVLRALGSKDMCPVSYNPEVAQVEVVITEPTPVCTETMREEFQNCSHDFYSKYVFEPLTILNKADDLQEICQDIDTHQQCFDQYAVCEQQSPTIGLRYLVRQVCSSQEIFKQHQKCLSAVKHSDKGGECLSVVDLKPELACSSLTKMIDCIAKDVQEECGEDSLKFVVDITNEYLHNSMPSSECLLSVPTIALETGCSEQQLIQYLECEALVDSYRFRPITFISNASSWDSFCEMIGSKYRPCLDKLECRFEPVSTASITLFENLCEREITRRDQRKYAECLAEVADSQTGKKCLEVYKNIDFLARDAPEQVCLNIEQILSCIGLPISKKCGNEALLHVYDIHGTWIRVFNSTCTLQPSKDVDVEFTFAATKSISLSSTTAATTTTAATQKTQSVTTTESVKSILPSNDATRSLLYQSVIALTVWLLF